MWNLSFIKFASYSLILSKSFYIFPSSQSPERQSIHSITNKFPSKESEQQFYQNLRHRFENHEDLASTALALGGFNPYWIFSDHKTVWELACLHDGPKEIILNKYKGVINTQFSSKLTAIEDAARKGKAQDVHLFLSHRAKPGYAASFARKAGYEEIAQKIESSIYEVGQESKKLRCGIEQNNFKAVKEAIDFGLDIDDILAASTGYGALHLAIFYGKFDSSDEQERAQSEAILDLILKQNPCYDQKDKEGLTAINFAVKYRRKAAEIILEQDRDFHEINDKSTDGLAPIHRAAQHGSINLWYSLRRKGADIKLFGMWWDVFGFAFNHDNIEILIDLLDYGWTFDARNYLLNKGSTQAKKAIIERLNLEILYRIIHKDHLLKRFVLEDETELLEALHVRGVSFDTPQEAGNSALHYAVEYMKYKTAEWLLLHGAKAYLQNNKKNKPFDLIQRTKAWADASAEDVHKWQKLFKSYPRNRFESFLKKGPHQAKK